MMNDLDVFIKAIPTPTSYIDSGFDQYFDRNLFFAPSESNFVQYSYGTSAADLMNSAEGFSSGALTIDIIRGGIFVKDDQGVERVIIGNF